MQPTEGGQYTRDPKTGEMTRTEEPTAPATSMPAPDLVQPEAAAIEPSDDGRIPKDLTPAGDDPVTEPIGERT